MNQMKEPTTNPTWQPSNEEQGRSGIVKLVEGLADIVIEAGPMLRQWEEQKAQQQLQSFQRVEAILVRQQEHLLLGNQRLAGMEQNFSNMTRELAKSAEHGLRLDQRLETLGFNLEQVRLLAETIAQKHQQLVDDFIERRVTDHLFKEFLNIQCALVRYAASGNPNLKADIQATAEGIGSFLAESGLRIINPSPGLAFEPREHQPVKVLPVNNPTADGTIAETFTPGLSRSHRVIQMARVAVFKADGVKTAN